MEEARGAARLGEAAQVLCVDGAGWNKSAACREVGIFRKTGTKWRLGYNKVNRAGEVYFVPLAAKPISARFLSEDERITIADGVQAGRAIRAIARSWAARRRRFSREVARNRDPERGARGRRRPPCPASSIPPRDRDKTFVGVYHPHRAQQWTRARRTRPKPRKLAVQPQLHAWVQDRLGQRWSPEQISRSLPGYFPDQAEMRVATETIYQALYV